MTVPGHLLPLLGKRLLVDIEARDLSRYQKTRIAEGASGRTANLEVGVLRQIMRKHGIWARIQTDVHMLADRQDAGRALNTGEESVPLAECSRSGSRALYTLVRLALETGARRNTIRTLQWRNVDFVQRCHRLGKDKTASGTGRIVPFSQRAEEILKFWAQQFPHRLPNNVFPADRVGAAGNKFDAKAYATDPTKPIASVKEAWESAKQRTRRHCPHCASRTLADKPKPGTGYASIACYTEMRELPAGLVSVSFHDLRHTAVRRLIAAGVPLPVVCKIVGWSAGTMAKMAARYGHFGLEELRSAVEAIAGQGENFAQVSPQSPHGSQNRS